MAQNCLNGWMRPQIFLLKSFLIESIYNLSDTTKSFLLILVTDLHVGVHPPRQVLISDVRGHHLRFVISIARHWQGRWCSSSVTSSILISDSVCGCRA